MKKLRYLILMLLFIPTIYIWSALFTQPDDNLLEVHFFDVDQGDSILIETPSGKQILIDGGPNSSVLEKLGQEMDFFDRHIDIVISTHPDADHLTGLIEVLEQFEVGLVLVSGIEKETVTFAKWTQLIEEKNIVLKEARAGQKIELDQGIYLNILWPQEVKDRLVEEVNDYAVVVQLVYDQAEFLFAADIAEAVELKLLGSELQSDVLKIAHHGSRGSTNPLFLEKVDPEIAVISVGKNSYGHPHEDTLAKLAKLRLLRTDLSGDLTLLTNGQTLKISTEK